MTRSSISKSISVEFFRFYFKIAKTVPPKLRGCWRTDDLPAGRQERYQWCDPPAGGELKANQAVFYP